MSEAGSRHPTGQRRALLFVIRRSQIRTTGENETNRGAPARHPSSIAVAVLRHPRHDHDNQPTQAERQLKTANKNVQKRIDIPTKTKGREEKASTKTYVWDQDDPKHEKRFCPPSTLPSTARRFRWPSPQPQPTRPTVQAPTTTGQAKLKTDQKKERRAQKKTSNIDSRPPTTRTGRAKTRNKSPTHENVKRHSKSQSETQSKPKPKLKSQNTKNENEKQKPNTLERHKGNHHNPQRSHERKHHGKTSKAPQALEKKE
ncbi:hypothetical protein GALMADRAFT_215179 [Galerina marginata CBS 339.88]|uniref:Uncharacterized protein n=1 Tax=Galerina marginata (strain CBS 339.88) TaxID=685588 RepID=A0A067SPC5_GALM3|nr:hypothetical protein GALMADRAFT_215179 [Galerina marginata CBS 339.88]